MNIMRPTRPFAIAAIATLTFSIGGCFGDTSQNLEPTAVTTSPTDSAPEPVVSPSEQSTSAPQSPQPSSSAARRAELEAEACPLSAEALESVVSLDVLSSKADLDYGYDKDRSCDYMVEDMAWYIYLVPADSDHARAQRYAAENYYEGTTSFTADGAADALLFEDGQQALLEVGDTFVRVEVQTNDGRAFAKDVIVAVADALNATEG